MGEAIHKELKIEVESSPALWKSQGGRPGVYPWHDLPVSQYQSFFVPGFPDDDLALTKTWNSLSSCRCNIQKRTGKKFAIRKDREDGVRGLRVWRVK